MSKFKIGQTVIINTNPDYLISIGYKKDGNSFVHPNYDSIPLQMQNLDTKITNIIEINNAHHKGTHYQVLLDNDEYNWPPLVLFPIDSEYGKFLYGT